MAATAVQIADAVRADLAAQAFSQAVDVIRAYVPLVDLAAFTGIRLSVVAAQMEISAANRHHDWHELSVDVGLQAKVASAEPEHVDPILALTEEVIDHLRRHKLAAAPEAKWFRANYVTICHTDHLKAHNVVTSVVRVTYRVLR